MLVYYYYYLSVHHLVSDEVNVCDLEAKNLLLIGFVPEMPQGVKKCLAYWASAT